MGGHYHCIVVLSKDLQSILGMYKSIKAAGLAVVHLQLPCPRNPNPTAKRKCRFAETIRFDLDSWIRKLSQVYYDSEVRDTII